MLWPMRLLRVGVLNAEGFCAEGALTGECPCYSAIFNTDVGIYTRANGNAPGEVDKPLAEPVVGNFGVEGAGKKGRAAGRVSEGEVNFVSDLGQWTMPYVLPTLVR